MTANVTFMPLLCCHLTTSPDRPYKVYISLLKAKSILHTFQEGKSQKWYLNKYAECSKLQENVYFMGSVLSSCQGRATKVIERLVHCYFLAESIMYP